MNQETMKEQIRRFLLLPIECEKAHDLSCGIRSIAYRPNLLQWFRRGHVQRGRWVLQCVVPPHTPARTGFVGQALGESIVRRRHDVYL